MKLQKIQLNQQLVKDMDEYLDVVGPICNVMSIMMDHREMAIHEVMKMLCGGTYYQDNRKHLHVLREVAGSRCESVYWYGDKIGHLHFITEFEGKTSIRFEFRPLSKYT